MEKLAGEQKAAHLAGPTADSLETTMVEHLVWTKAVQTADRTEQQWAAQTAVQLEKLAGVQKAEHLAGPTAGSLETTKVGHLAMTKADHRAAQMEQ